jgi:hypothetical protein
MAHAMHDPYGDAEPSLAGVELDFGLRSERKVRLVVCK